MLAITLVSCAFALRASGFPFVLEQVSKTQTLNSRQVGVPSTEAALAASKARTNCGIAPCSPFDASEQSVSTAGDHAYASPAADEIRGPCPGLNAASNHGYLSRSGVTTVEETITGLGSAYAMGADFAGLLAVYAVLGVGDPVLGQWSIGGPPPTDLLTTGLLGQAQGISYSHNTYEGDTSIGRNDAYINNGDAHSLNVTRFAQAYSTCKNDRCTLDGFAEDYGKKQQESISTNPMYFNAFFSGALVAPAAYNFVINMMSNHSSDEPNGYLNEYTLKTFFAVTGTYPDYQWQKGQERIPDNWYRRPSATPYDVVHGLGDLGVQYLARPESFRIGGNAKGVNTYTGVDLGDLTGGVYNGTDLFGLDGSPHMACFVGHVIQEFIPDFANRGLNLLSPVTDLVNKFVTPITGGLDCPSLDKYDQTLFNEYPGHSYNPTGPGTNY